MRLSICLIAIIMCTAQAYFQDDKHRAKAAAVLESFARSFQERFDVVAFGQMEWHSKMELAFDYWVTSVRLRGLRRASFTYDLDIDGLVIRAPEITIELWVEEKYTIPIKITKQLLQSYVQSFEFTALLLTSKDKIRCTGVQIDYEDLSLDIGTVVEYITRQVLSLSSVKEAIKASEIPIRNLIAQAFIQNWELYKPVVEQLRTRDVNVNDYIERALNVNGIQANGEEFWLQTRQLWNMPSTRKTQKTEDL